MKRYVDSSISAIDLGDEFYGNAEGLQSYLDSLPVGAKITDIVNAPGSHWAGVEAICEKCSGYSTVYYNPWGVPPSDAKSLDTWWSLSGSKINTQKLAKIITEGTQYYCTADVFEDDDF